MFTSIKRRKVIVPPNLILFSTRSALQNDPSEYIRKAPHQCSLFLFSFSPHSAIFGPKDPELGVHIQSLCDSLDIPHLEARLQNLGERDINREFSVNLHPGSLAISESLRELVIYLNWTRVAIIYQDDMCKWKRN